MGSSRLPGKVLKTIGEEPLLGHVLHRLKHLRHRATVVVATSELEQDDAIAAFCEASDTACFRGSESNVLERYFRCAAEFGFDQIVRLTADNPFTDVEELDALIDLHLKTGADFSHSFASLPIGVGAEIFSFAALERSHREGHEAHHIEHVDEYMLEHPELFRIQVCEASPGKRYPDMRLTVDTMEDYKKACRIVASSQGRLMTVDEVIRFCLHSA